MEYVFDIEQPGEPAAGILPFTDRISVSVASGDPGGEPGEFFEHILNSIVEWYDGAKVSLSDVRISPVP